MILNGYNTSSFHLFNVFYWSYTVVLCTIHANIVWGGNKLMIVNIHFDQPEIIFYRSKNSNRIALTIRGLTIFFTDRFRSVIHTEQFIKRQYFVSFDRSIFSSEIDLLI